MLAALANLALLAAILLNLKELLMKNHVTVAAMAAASLVLAGCQSFDFAAYTAAANELDPDCYKDVDIRVQPLLLPGFVVPIVSGGYRKVCHPELAPGPTPPAGLAGGVVGSPAPR